MSFLRGAGKRIADALLKPPDPRPRFHGDKPDPRYPSPRELRGNVAPLIDLAIHAGITAAVVYAVQKNMDNALVLVGLGILTFLAVSLVHTVVLQRIFRATLGKGICGVVFIRTNDGSYPSFGRLLSWYFMRGIATLMDAMPDDPGDAQDIGLSVVRRRDVKALRSSAGNPGAQANSHQQYTAPPPGYPPNLPMPHGNPARHRPGSIPQPYPPHGYPPNSQPPYGTPPPNPHYRQQPNPPAPGAPYSPNRYPPG